LNRKNIIYYEKIDSTQKEIWRRIEKSDIENGTVIIAKFQTDAIGTHGRTWYTRKDNNLAFSFVVFPNCDINKLYNLTYEIAEIIVSILKNKYKVKLDIKLPNDLMINNKKVGGILTETKLQGNIVKCIVIGIGINTNSKEDSKEIEKISTSIGKEFDVKINNNDVMNEFLDIFEEKFSKRIGEKK